MAEASDLVAMVEDNPEDPEVIRTYCDWLEQQGDARRSYLLGLHQIRDKLTDSFKIDRTKLDHIDARITAYFEEHRDYFWGPLAKIMPAPTASRQRRVNAQEIEWRNAFIYKVRLQPIARPKIGKLVELLLTSESGRFLVEFDSGWYQDDPATVIAALAANAPRTLRRVDISDQGKGTAYADLWPALSRVEELTISGGTGYATIALPNVHTLDLGWCRDPEDLTRGFAHGGLPALRRLVLRFRENRSELLAMLAPLSIVDQLEILELEDPAAVAGTPLARIARPYSDD